MNRDQLESLHKAFTTYCRLFYSASADGQRNVLLKEVHTAKVCENMAAIAVDVFADEDRQNVAQAVALFHDVGRFPQYHKYGTFRDSDSVNHAALGASVLREENFLAELAAEERDVIESAVRFHNVFAIPPNIAAEVLPFLKLVRDADKLDIWRVFIEYFDSPPEERASAAGLGFPDDPFCSQEVVEQILHGQMVHLSRLKTLNDFKLLQLSWVFDLNYPASFRLVAERRYLQRLSASLPKTPEVRAALDYMNDFLQQRLPTGA